MDHSSTRFRDSLHSQLRNLEGVSVTTALAYILALVFLLHSLLHHFDVAVLSPGEALWNALVYITPQRLLLDANQRRGLGQPAMWSQTHAAKSEALRRMLGVGGQTLMQQVPTTAGLVRKMSIATGTMTSSAGPSDAPPGLGNWDNSCYQNSVLQGLSSMESLSRYLREWSPNVSLPENSTVTALDETTAKLRDPTNNGRHIWTPAKLKSMSSWQQQDAQEYFSKIMDELDKEVGTATRSLRSKPGIEAAAAVAAEQEETCAPQHELGPLSQNPLEGLLSQRVACTSCGFSDGLSLIPFNCLTVPLGSSLEYDIRECFDDYAKVEPITGVDCTKCTLLKAETELKRMLSSEQSSAGRPPEDTSALKNILRLPPEVRAQISQRLTAVQGALDSDDFSDETLNRTCKISKSARVSSTKTRQAMIARPPQNLVVHVNRSVFDESTGTQRKNHATVRYPALLDLGPWVMGPVERASKTGTAAGLPTEGMWKYVYRLRAVVTHYGRHENGHYIAYRQSPPNESEDGADAEGSRSRWWRLSDEDVSPFSEESVLAQGGVFMLFYERDANVSSPETPPNADAHAVEQPQAATLSADFAAVADAEPKSPRQTINMPKPEAEKEPAAAVALPPCPVDAGDPVEVTASEASTTEDESEADAEAEDEVPAMAAQELPPSSPPLMRTASAGMSSVRRHGGGGGDDHWSIGRVVAAT